MAIDPEEVLKECRVTCFLSSGPGGQRRDRKRTAVRLAHRPTGIVTVSSRRRSRAQNLQAALDRLVTRIEERQRVGKPRIPTRIPSKVKSAVLAEKRARSLKKKLRRKVSHHDSDE